MSSNKSIGSDCNIFVWALGCLIVLIVKDILRYVFLLPLDGKIFFSYASIM